MLWFQATIILQHISDTSSQLPPLDNPHPNLERFCVECFMLCAENKEDLLLINKTAVSREKR